MDAKKLFIFSLVITAMAIASVSAAPLPTDSEGGPFVYCLHLCSSTFGDANCDAECLGGVLGHGKCIFTGPSATQKTCCCHG